MATNSIFPFVVGSLLLTVIMVYFICIRKPSKPSHIQTSTVRRNRQALNQNECCICLNEQKKFQVSITCGHSFCGKCLLSLYNHSNEKLKCPLCRQQISLIFKAWHDQQPQAQSRKIQQQIREYNHKFSDERSFFRKFTQFPFVLRAASDRLFTIAFIRYFFSTTNLLKMFGTMVLYFMSPLDLLPQILLGPAGYVDDFWFMVIVFLYTVANSVMEYVRSRQ